MRPHRAVPLALALLAACATFQKERGHDQVAQLVRERAGAHTGWESGGPDAEQIDGRVGELLSSGLTLERAVEVALINSPDLQATYEQLGVSQSDLIQAGLLKNPIFFASVGFPRVPGSLNEAELSLVQDFLDLFMLPLRKSVAQDQFLADVSRVAHQALATAADVKKAVVELQTTERLLATQRQIQLAAEAAAELASKQYAAGNITELERATRRAASEEARVEVAQLELSLVSQREQLNRRLGLWGPRTAWTLAAPLAELPTSEALPDHLEALAIQQRLDIAAARIEAALLGKAADLARTWRWFGRIEVGVHTHEDPNGPRLVGPTLALDLPILDQRQGVIARLESQQRQSERRLAALSVDARSRVRETLARVSSARAHVEHFNATVLPLRQVVVDQTQLQYNGMQIGLYELLDARRAQAESQKAQFHALKEYWSARIDLEQLVGGRLPQ